MLKELVTALNIQVSILVYANGIKYVLSLKKIEI